MGSGTGRGRTRGRAVRRASGDRSGAGGAVACHRGPAAPRPLPLRRRRSARSGRQRNDSRNDGRTRWTWWTRGRRVCRPGRGGFDFRPRHRRRRWRRRRAIRKRAGAASLGPVDDVADHGHAARDDDAGRGDHPHRGQHRGAAFVAAMAEGAEDGGIQHHLPHHGPALRVVDLGAARHDDAAAQQQRGERGERGECSRPRQLSNCSMPSVIIGKVARMTTRMKSLAR